MWIGSRISNAVCSHRPYHLLTSTVPFRVASSVSLSKDLRCLDEDCNEFLPWLQEKAGNDISTCLTIGTSIYGRSLFASKFIQAGDCILRVPYSAQIKPNNIQPSICSFLNDDVGDVARLALVILAEQKMGQGSEWAPYIYSLPQIGELHSTIFWGKDELEMVRQSPIYEETLKHQSFIENQFLKVKPALEHFPQNFGDATFASFMHTYALDFLNHYGVSGAVLLSDDDKEISEVIADRDYTCGEQVFISYGKFSNATLLLDFGFTLPCNTYDQVQILMGISQQDSLHKMKVELLHGHSMPTINLNNSFQSSFSIKEVRSNRGKGKGIPQSLRAFARVLSATSSQELEDLATEAAQNDGRLARRPLKDRNRETEAHEMLLSEITRMIQEYDASMKSLGYMNSHIISNQHVFRRKMARDLLTGVRNGEIRRKTSSCDTHCL